MRNVTSWIVGCAALGAGCTAGAPLPGPADMTVGDALLSQPDVAGFHKRIFVTDQKYTGNLKKNGGGTDGLDGADKICNQAAAALSLGGAWKAWLSTSNVDAIDRIADVGPWYLTHGGGRIFVNKAAIAAGPEAPIGPGIEGGDTWTGTLASGRKDVFTCLDWTVDAVGGPGAGSGGVWWRTGSSWTAAIDDPCNLLGGLYCFEQ